ncbi:MAG: hypothetical protein M3N56_09710 [Actinomycetota bacterium]|nr:hypothetical protein [Actinomycetota bacterium]
MSELWRRWLGYRLPHYDAMARAARATLIGDASAVVRVGFDGAKKSLADWHVTLFTRTPDTPDPDATVEATRRFKPAGMVLHHVLTGKPSPWEQPTPDPRPRMIVDALRRAGRAREAMRRAEADHRVPATTVDRSRSSAQTLANAARVVVEEAITDGLKARSGFLLIPPMIIKPEMLEDWAIYQDMLATHAALSSYVEPAPQTWRPIGVAVCASCTLVFIPRRRSTAEYCPLCSKRKAEPNVIGQAPLGTRQRQAVRVPNLAGSMITGWKKATIAICGACGQPFAGRRDAKACPACANRARQHRHRATSRRSS